MTVYKEANGVKPWKVDVQPGGRGGKRFRKSFKNKAEALAWEAWIKTQVNQEPEWMPEKRDLRKLSSLASEWYEAHGKGLKAGQDTYSRLKLMIKDMGDPVADRFTVDTFTSYRARRIESGITASNMNREHAYLRAMFNELARLGKWSKENPLARLRGFKVQQDEMKFLNIDEIKTLLIELDRSGNPHLGLIARVCLATGARWGEAEGLKMTQIQDGQITYAQTKSGKVRHVKISAELEELLREHHKKHGKEGRLFTPSRSAFAVALARTNLSLPNGQMTHVLRHTFASHFIKETGDILSLQRLLGHSDLKMTMRYAHLAPEHLALVLKANPLALTLG